MIRTGASRLPEWISRMDWTLFENLDRLRRQQGALLDALGLGPLEAPYREVFRAPGASLRRYGSGDESGPLVLIVPAPIKRPYVWDLAPEVSAVRRCLARGARVFLVDWQPAPPQFGLAEYGARLIRDCLDAAGAARAVLLAHSLGGLFAAIFSALYPERVQGLALLAAPLHFGADTPVFRAMVAGLDADDLPAAVLPVVEAAAGRDKTVLHYDGDVGVSLQHVGPLVGRRAHALLWPRILAWIERVAQRAA